MTMFDVIGIITEAKCNGLIVDTLRISPFDFAELGGRGHYLWYGNIKIIADFNIAVREAKAEGIHEKTN